MPTNTQAQYAALIPQFIQEEALPLAQRQLIIWQAGDPMELAPGNGLTYLATRFNRLPLPYAPLSEGVPPIGQTMTFQQVTGTCLEWGDKITFTNVAVLTVTSPLMQKANMLLGMQIAETQERNTFNALLAATNVNYVNSRGSRAALQAGDVLDIHTINRTVAAMRTNGALEFNGPTETNVKVDAGKRGTNSRANMNDNSSPHFLAITSHLALADVRENSTFVLASIYAANNKLYNGEVGMWGGLRFCGSNMVPSWVGVAQVNGIASGVGGSLATGTYYIVVTGSDTQNQYESRIYQVSAAININGPTGSIQVTTPITTGFTYSVYLGTTTSPANLALSSAGPTTGPLQGQATQIAANTVVTLTNTGLAQVPPAAPATGVTVYPTYVLGRECFGKIMLDNVEFNWLDKADKSDPNNQLRIISWRMMYGVMVLNQVFLSRIESSSAFSTTFT